MNTVNVTVRERYDFSSSTPNPYAKRTKQRVTIRLDLDTVSYLRTMSEEKGIPQQSLVNLYLRDCAASRRELSLEWTKGRRASGDS